MYNVDSFKKSLVQDTNMWIFVWILMVVNLFALLCISLGYSARGLVITVVLVLAGIPLTRRLSAWAEKSLLNSDKNKQLINELMKKIRPVCDDVFNKEIDRITQPIMNEIEQDFSLSLNWLWENCASYRMQLQQGIDETSNILQVAHSLNRSKEKIVRKIQDNHTQLQQLMDDIHDCKEKDQQELGKLLQSKAIELKEGMEKEKEIFYEYMQKLLQQQILNEDIALAQHFNMNKLGEQFSVVIEKSIQVRLDLFRDSVVEELEYMVTDNVGRTQKGALQLRNLFDDLMELSGQLVQDADEIDMMMVGALEDSQSKMKKLKEASNDILVTLAWQDILIEKRWHELQTSLFMLRDQVLRRVTAEVVQYITGVLNDTIPGYIKLAGSPDTAVVYKACLDAEIIYQLFTSGNSKNLIDDGVYALLQFIRPLDLLVSAALRMNSIGLAERRLIREQLREPEYMQKWEQVVQEVHEQKPEILRYMDDSYPLGFNAFCSNPDLQEKPENVNEAAWMLFMASLESPNYPPDGFLLVGLLLVAQRLRNLYVHPLKKTPRLLEKPEEIEYIRFCTYRSIEILQSLTLNGNVRNRLV